MNPTLEAGLRSLGVVILFGILGWFGSVTNVSQILGGTWAPIVASLAAVALGMLDKYYSPDGTVVAGTVGRAR